MRIGIVLGSVREGRAGEPVANWVLERARTHGGADVEFIDVKSFGLPVFVGYGADGAVRAVEHWRQIFGNFDAKAIRAQLSINIFAEMTENGFVPNERRAGELDALLDSLIAAVG